MSTNTFSPVNPILFLMHSDANPSISSEYSRTYALSDPIYAWKWQLIQAQIWSNNGLTDTARRILSPQLRLEVHQSNDPFFIGLSNIVEAEIEAARGAQERTRQLAESTTLLLGFIEKKEELGYLHEMLGWLRLRALYEHDTASYHFETAHTIFKDLPYVLRQATTLAGCAAIFERNFEAKKSLPLRQKAYAMIADMDAPYPKSWMAHAVAQDARYSGDIALAREMYNNSIHESMLCHDESSVSCALIGLGHLDLQEHAYQQAAKNLERALPPLLYDGNMDMWALANSMLSYCYAELQYPIDQVLSYIRASEAQVRLYVESPHNMLRFSVEYIMKTYERLLCFQEALNYSHHLRRIEKIMSTRSRESQIAELETQYELRLKDQHIASLQKENEHQQKTSQLFAKLALEDVLTKAPNRRSVMDSLQLKTQNQEPVVALLLDIDFFKKINDTYGHDAGDKALIAFKRGLDDVCARFHGEYGRMGGEEWLILMPNMSVVDETFTHLRTYLDNNPVIYGPYQIFLYFSMGVCVYDSTMDVPELLRHADEALYVAKNSGRNQYRVFMDL